MWNNYNVGEVEGAGDVDKGGPLFHSLWNKYHFTYNMYYSITQGLPANPLPHLIVLCNLWMGQ